MSDQNDSNDGKKPDDQQDVIEGVFTAVPWEYDEDAVGVMEVESGDHRVFFLAHPEDSVGICMSPEHAEKLARDLLRAVKAPGAPWNEAKGKPKTDLPN